VHGIYADVQASGHHPRRLPENVTPLATHEDLLRAHWVGRRYARYPLAAVAAPEARSFGDFARLGALSLSHGDTRPLPSHAAAWGGMLVRHLRRTKE
jgi:hypothetical protein